MPNTRSVVKLGISPECVAQQQAVYNQPLESAVFTIDKKNFQIVYLPQLDKYLHVLVDTVSLLTFINLKTWEDLQENQSWSLPLAFWEHLKTSPLNLLGIFRQKLYNKTILVSLQF